MDVGFDFTAGSLPVGATLTRASSGTRFNSSGVLVTESSNVARFDYDPRTLSLRGLLIEPASTNLLLRTTTLDNATSWTQIGVNTVTGSQTDMAGGSTASIWADSDATALAGVQQAPSLAATTTYSVSVYVKKDAIPKTTRIIAFRWIQPSMTWIGLDTSTGEIAVLAASTQQPLAYTCTDKGGWWHVHLAFTTVSSGGSGLLIYGAYGSGPVLSAITNTASLTGNGPTIAHPQLEVGSKPTSYIATTTATVTRSADVLTLNWAGKGVADGTYTLRYTFDDASTQDVSTTVASGVSTVPTSLNRTRIRSVIAVGVLVPDTFNNPTIFPILPGQAFPVVKSPVWSTAVASASSGRERRRQNWSYPRWRFSITHEVLRDTASYPELQRLFAFFNDQAGQANSFYFYDPNDCLVTDQPFGTGDGTTRTFQLKRTLGAGAITFDEPIRGVVAGAVFKINGTPTTAYTLGSNGLITFTTAPASSAALTWTGQFMFLCRFEQDQLDAEQMMQSLWSQGGLKLISVKV